MSASTVPHSFVLADLFDVEAMRLDIPDHIYENQPGLEWVTCPDCDGVGSIACYGLSPYGDSAKAWGRPDLDLMYKPCVRCNQYGEVLDVPLSDLEPSFGEALTSFLLAA